LKVLVTGANGLLGSKLVEALSTSYEVFPTDNAQAVYSKSMRMDIADANEVLEIFSEVRPDAVIHAAAETNVDKCETDRGLAWRVNAEGTRNISQACAKIEAKLIYMSTDYIFDGEKGLYTEYAQANPLNYYGLTKLKGEEFVRELCHDYVIARTSVLYGWHPRKLNFATWVIDSLKDGKRISVVNDHYNSPTLSDNLAEMIQRALKVHLSGVYHMAGGERISRYNFALKIAEMFDLDKALISPMKVADLEAWIAKRPRDSSLCVDKIRKEVGIEPLNLDEALRRMKKGEHGMVVRETESF